MTDKLLPLPERETQEMHNAVMAVLYAGVGRTETDKLWQAYRSALLAHLAAQQAEPSSFDRAYWDQRATEHEGSADPEYQQYGAGIRDVLRAMGKAQQAEPAPVVGEPSDDIAGRLEAHIRTLRLSGRNDGLVDDIARAVLALRSQPVQAEPVKPLGYINAGHLHEMQQGRLPYAYLYQKEELGASVPVYYHQPASHPTSQPVQAEPVAWTVAGDITNWAKDFSKYRTQHYVRPVYTAPTPQAVPPLGDAVMMGDEVFAGIFEDDIRPVGNAVVISFQSTEGLRSFLLWHHGITQPQQEGGVK